VEKRRFFLSEPNSFMWADLPFGAGNRGIKADQRAERNDP
jgi:hypothetical protein